MHQSTRISPSSLKHALRKIILPKKRIKEEGEKKCIIQQTAQTQSNTACRAWEEKVPKNLCNVRLKITLGVGKVIIDGSYRPRRCDGFLINWFGLIDFWGKVSSDF